jgi:O-antigen/teichoic acid export membrane protein
MSTQNSYRQIFKATSIYGGVQVIVIIVAIIRSKFIAMLLGPSGMGIVALLTSTLAIIRNVTEFGLGTSAIKSIAAAHASGDENKVGTVIVVLRRWVLITGLLAVAVTMILAPWLSNITFGNNQYIWAFIFISITLLFTQMSDGQSALLQGTRQTRYLAQTNLLGTLLGLLISIPLYYFFGEGGIVPAIILSAASILSLNWFFANKVKIKKVAVDKETIIRDGKQMLTLGFILSLGWLVSSLTSYVIRVFIGKHGNIADVGLYNAGLTIVGTYVGLVFTSMGTDYYPRLASIADDRAKLNREINHQTEIALLILAPMLAAFIVYANFGIIVLYTKEFLQINSMIQWSAVGIFFKTVSWTIGFIFLAKGASKVYFWNELISNSYQLILNLIGYYYWGLTGLGVAFLLGFILYFFQVFFIAHRLYAFRFSNTFYKVFFVQLSISAICLLIARANLNIYTYVLCSFLILISLLFSFKELDKRMEISKLILQKLKKDRRK